MNGVSETREKLGDEGREQSGELLLSQNAPQPLVALALDEVPDVVLITPQSYLLAASLIPSPVFSDAFLTPFTESLETALAP